MRNADLTNQNCVIGNDISSTWLSDNDLNS